MTWLTNPFRFGVAPSDPSIASVVNLSHCDGADGSTTITNSVGTGNPFAPGGSTCTISTAQSVFGGASLRGPANNGSIAPSDADYGYGTGDFCIELRLRPDSTIGFGGIGLSIFWDQRSVLGSSVFPTLYYYDNGRLVYFVNGVDRIVSSAGAIVATTWHAIALARVSGTTRLFLNGTQVGSSYTDANNYATSQIGLFSGPSGGAPTQGAYMDEIRVTNGVGRYAANYTVATTSFPNA